MEDRRRWRGRDEDGRLRAQVVVGDDDGKREEDEIDGGSNCLAKQG